MSTETRTDKTQPADTKKKVGEGLAEELAEILHLPADQLRPLPRTV